MTTVAHLVNREHQDEPERATAIINRATQAINSAADRQRNREFRKLEE